MKRRESIGSCAGILKDRHDGITECPQRIVEAMTVTGLNHEKGVPVAQAQLMNQQDGTKTPEHQSPRDQTPNEMSPASAQAGNHAVARKDAPPSRKPVG